ncbi:MAG: hypothetical protein EOO46_14295 [Flavobacterium sp.]|nr:MAG: hypothetical protein EOO46_14295 [Flavobacterium sp.]
MTPTNADGNLVLKGTSWQYSASIIPASTSSGRLDLLHPVSQILIKRIICWATPSNAIEKNFCGVNPNLSGLQLVSSSQAWPQTPLQLDASAFVAMQNSR